MGRERGGEGGGEEERECGGRGKEGGVLSSSAHGASKHKILHNFYTSAPAGPKYVFQMDMNG